MNEAAIAGNEGCEGDVKSFLKDFISKKFFPEKKKIIDFDAEIRRESKAGVRSESN